MLTVRPAPCPLPLAQGLVHIDLFHDTNEHTNEQMFSFVSFTISSSRLQTGYIWVLEKKKI